MKLGIVFGIVGCVALAGAPVDRPMVPPAGSGVFTVKPSTRWSPFSEPFISADPKTISDFEVSADIVVGNGPMDNADPLAFEAWALSDLLVNQVSSPK